MVGYLYILIREKRYTKNIQNVLKKIIANTIKRTDRCSCTRWFCSAG